jgi:hypothetical protein
MTPNSVAQLAAGADTHSGQPAGLRARGSAAAPMHMKIIIKTVII